MKLRLFLLVLALQSAWLLGTVVVKESALRSGPAVRLETVPVDPRDLLRGDFVILRYKISDLPAALFTPPVSQPLPGGRPVWVLLEPRGEFHEAVQASTGPLKPGPDQAVIRGTTVRSGGGSTRVEYGLERYYVKEGTGNPQGKLTVEATVTPRGRAMISQVFVDGVPYAEAQRRAAREANP